MMQVMMRWWLGFLDPAAAAAAAACNKVVVVVDGEKKPSTTALDWVLTQVVKQDQGDQITILAFLQQVTSPMGNRMVANVDVFGGVNAACLKQAAASTKQAIEKKIKDTRRCQFCNKKRLK